MKPRTYRPTRSCDVQFLEARRLCAASVTVEITEDRVVVITGTRRSDDIAVVEHFPGIGIYDVLANGEMITQIAPSLSSHSFRIEGRRGSDRLSVNAASAEYPAILLGGSGNDTLSGTIGADYIDGGPGRDVLTGHAGNDALFGRDGNDSISGGDGDDALDGGAGRDSLSGDAGNDSLAGGRGRDAVTGGSGADVFSLRDRDSEVTDLLQEDERDGANPA